MFIVNCCENCTDYFYDLLRITPYEVVFERAPRLPLELELGITHFNPTTRSNYLYSVKSVFRDVRQIAKESLSNVSEKRARHNHGTNTWKPFHDRQTVLLKRPKCWKLGNKWVGRYRISKRLGVKYKLVSRSDKEKVLHHDQLKLIYIPLQPGELVCPIREVGEFQVVDVAPQQAKIPRARPARLKPSFHIIVHDCRLSQDHRGH